MMSGHVAITCHGKVPVRRIQQKIHLCQFMQLWPTFLHYVTDKKLPKSKPSNYIIMKRFWTFHADKQFCFAGYIFSSWRVFIQGEVSCMFISLFYCIWVSWISFRFWFNAHYNGHRDGSGCDCCFFYSYRDVT